MTKRNMRFSPTHRFAFGTAAVVLALVTVAVSRAGGNAWAVLLAAGTVSFSVLFVVSLTARTNSSAAPDENESRIPKKTRLAFGIGMFTPLAGAAVSAFAALVILFTSIASGQVTQVATSVLPWLLATIGCVAVSQAITARYGKRVRSVV